MSPFDPTAILDEIQRLVPGYDVSRMNLMAGNSEHTSLVAAGPGVAHRTESIHPRMMTFSVPEPWDDIRAL